MSPGELTHGNQISHSRESLVPYSDSAHRKIPQHSTKAFPITQCRSRKRKATLKRKRQPHFPTQWVCPRVDELPSNSPKADTDCDTFWKAEHSSEPPPPPQRQLWQGLLRWENQRHTGTWLSEHLVRTHGWGHTAPSGCQTWAASETGKAVVPCCASPDGWKTL